MSSRTPRSVPSRRRKVAPPPVHRASPRRAAGGASEVARLQARLAEAEHQLREIVENSLASIFIHWENRLLFVNETFARTFGYDSVEEVMAIGDWLQFPAPHERLRMEGYRQARIAGQTAPARYYFQGERKDGSRIWLENVVRLVTWRGAPAILGTMLDVTERVEIEQELRRSEERFRVAFQHAPLAVGVSAPGQGYLQVNDEFCALLGRSREEILNHPSPLRLVSEVTHPEDLARDLKQFARLIAGEIDTYRLEKRYLRPSGEVRWGELAVSASRNESGAVRMIISHILDTTERKLAELALEESRERFRVAFEEAPVGLGLAEFKRGGVQANPAMCRFFGRPAEWFRDHPDRQAMLQEITHPNDLAKDLAQFERLRRGEIGAYQLEERYLRPDGEPRWGQVSISATRHSDGRLRYVIVQITDITQRKSAELALLESEERFRVAFEEAPVGLALGTPEGGWRQTNRAFLEFLGLKPDAGVLQADLSSQTHAFSSPEDSAEHLRLHNELVEGKRETFELVKRYRHMDGGTRWANLHVGVIRNPDRSVKWIVSQRMDITPQKEAEAALRLSEERFRIAFEHAPIGMSLINPKTGRVQTNRAFAELVGRPTQTLQKANNFDKLSDIITHPDDAAVTLDGFRKLAAGELQAFQQEKRYLRPDGSIRWGILSSTVVRNESEEGDYLINQVVDITPSKEAEAALLRSEERFRIAFEDAPLAVAVSEPDRGWVQANAAMAQFLGRSREELLAFPNEMDLVRLVTHPDDLEANLAEYAKLRGGESDGYRLEKRYIRPSGEVRWGLLNVSASRGRDGRLNYTVSQVADITALKRAEQGLREREAGLAAAQRLAHLGSWELENLRELNGWEVLELAWVRWSDELFRIFGMIPRPAPVTGGEFLKGIHPDDRLRVWQAVREAVEKRRQFDLEHRIVRADGSERVVRHLSEILYDRATPRVLRIRGTVQDITGQKELEIKLLQSQKLESLGLLAGGIAHDFNNLLTGILGYATLARFESETGKLDDYLGQIEAGGRRAAELCQQMLAFAGRGRFEVRPFSIAAAVQDTLPLLEVSLPKKIELVRDLAPDLPPVVADVSQIRQIVMNLVTNAADAIGQAEGRITITTGAIKADLDYLAQTYLSPDLPAGDYVFLEVRDTGSGMTPEVQSKIFDPFFTTKFAGRGLGLAAVLGIVRAHRGALKVHSEPGLGSTLRLLLPAAVGAVAAESRLRAGPWTGSGLALVIDDDPTVRGVAQRMLETLGFDVEVASDGREGLVLSSQQTRPVRLVLLDLTMPHLDGEETFRALRAADPTATVVLMSGFTQQEALDRFAGTGLAAFLQKPFSLDSLRETLQRVLGDEAR